MSSTVFKGFERCWGPERNVAETFVGLEIECHRRSVQIGIQPLRWGVGLSYHSSDDLRMVFACLGPLHAQAAWPNNTPEAIAARKERSERTTARVYEMLEQRRAIKES